DNIVLHTACCEDDLDLVEFLFRFDNKIDLDKYLGIAAKNYFNYGTSGDIIKYLVSKGADIRSNDYNCLRCVCRCNDNPSLAYYLINVLNDNKISIDEEQDDIYIKNIRLIE